MKQHMPIDIYWYSNYDIIGILGSKLHGLEIAATATTIRSKKWSDHVSVHPAQELLPPTNSITYTQTCTP